MFVDGTNFFDKNNQNMHMQALMKRIKNHCLYLWCHMSGKGKTWAAGRVERWLGALLLSEGTAKIRVIGVERLANQLC